MCTQMDLEMCDVTTAEVQQVIENLVVYSWPGAEHRDLCGDPPSKPFPRMTYHDAMQCYGSDKPDTRFAWQVRQHKTVKMVSLFLATSAFSQDFLLFILINSV